MRDEIAHAATLFNLNTSLFAKVSEGIAAEEWTRRPCETTNCMLWIVGHMLWARSRCARMLGSQWQGDWVNQFERGARPGDGTSYPAPEQLLAAWKEIAEELQAGLERATQETLEREAHRPSLNGKVSGMVYFLVSHESYHMGQLAYVRCWLGKGGPQG
ncbi:MAG TPA: DinB family protein [Terracidiphilus sp.]|nr:DinB family protein [Terracidiphilus sp.]